MPIEFRTRTKAIQPNPNDIGACCVYNEEDSDFDCQNDVSFINCKRSNGIFKGKSSTCTTHECPTIQQSGIYNNLNSDQHGACVTCSTCTDNVTETQCITQENFDAEFFGGKLCAQVTNQNLSSLLSTAYGCCVDDGCFDTCNPNYCAELGGILHDGTNTEYALTCASNPCNPLDNSSGMNVGACCKNGSCIGILTKYDCERNGGSWKGEGSDCTSQGNYNCATDSSTTTTTTNTVDLPSSSLNGAQIVCSKPTTKHYYTDGKWSGVEGPTFGRESTIVLLTLTEAQCTNQGGVVCATDGDTSKAILWGGCQFFDGNIWKCEAKTEQQCVDLEGRWFGGIYCDQIRSYPATGLYFGSDLPSGINQGEKFLAGRCVLFDSVSAGIVGDDVKEKFTNCGDMLTEYQCVNSLHRLKEKYLNLGYGESNLDESVLSATWTPGKLCSECSTENEIPTSKTLGVCLLNRENTAQYPTEYTYTTGNPNICLDKYSKSDCEILHGEWINTCQTCNEITSKTNSEHINATHLGSCCYEDGSTLVCADSKTYGECNALNGFFHGPGTVCEGRDCNYVAYLDTSTDVNAECECLVGEDPDPTNANIVRIFATRNQQGNLWAGSTCGDPTVDAVPYFEEGLNFSSNRMVLYNQPVISQPGIPQQLIFTDIRDIGTDRYNLHNEGFRTFIRNDSGGSFLDDIWIQTGVPAYFRVDKQTPIRVPYSNGTLKGLTGNILETNQPASHIQRLVLNEPGVFWNDGPIPSHRKISYVNFDGMDELREFSGQMDNWSGFSADFESHTFDKLTVLEVPSSEIVALNLSNAEAIEKLNLANNQLQTLDLSSNQYLTEVDVSYNNLTSIDFGSTDKIYLSNLRVSFNPSLTTINGSYPQLRVFEAVDCGLSSMTFENMPYLTDVTLVDNPLTSFTIRKTPVISNISLDFSITNQTNLSSCILPNINNRDTTSIPPSISEAVIPEKRTPLNSFTCRNNIIPSDNYTDFKNKLCDLISITRDVSFRGTQFNGVDDWNSGTTVVNSIYTRTIDFSYTSGPANTNGGITNQTILNILRSLFTGTTINHDQQIRIILTGINNIGNWVDTGTYRTILSSELGTNYSRLSFII